MSIAPRRRPARARLRFEPLEARALMAVAGSLDRNFGAGHGYSTVSLGIPTATVLTGSIAVDSVITLPDGHIVVSGVFSIPVGNNPYGPTTLAIKELNADGTLDTSFGTNGQVLIPVTYGETFTAAAQSNGQIIEAESSPPQNGATSYLAFRLNGDGMLDPTFGTNGIAQYPAGVTTSSGDMLDSVTTILPLPSGQIILAGDSASGGLTAVRLNSDGTLDTSYGTDGTANVPVVPMAPGSEVSVVTTGAVLQAGGDVVLVGTVSLTPPFQNPGIGFSDGVLARLNAGGTLDTTFGGTDAGGVVDLPYDPSDLAQAGYSGALGVAVQPTTGDLLILGDLLVAKLDSAIGGSPIYFFETTGYTVDAVTANGTLDTAFGDTGQVLPSIPSGTISSLADGDIVLTGSTSIGYVSNASLLRLDPDGSPDSTFGNTPTPGLLVTRLNASRPTLAIQPVTNDIIMAGVSTVAALTGQSYGLAVDSILADATMGPSALTPPPPPPADLFGLGSTNAAVYDPTTGNFVYTLTAPFATYGSSMAPELGFAFGPKGAGQTIPAVADYQGLGHDQVAAYLPASGVYAILPTANSPGLFEPFGVPGAGQTIPAPADYYGTGRADVAVYIAAQGAFAIQDPAGKTSGEFTSFGSPGLGQSIPVPGDYFGTGRADIAVYLAASGVWAIQDPTGQTSGELIPFGKPGLGNSLPAPGDYDGSGKTELAVYVPGAGAFFYHPADGGNDVIVPIGTPNSGEIPAPGDYDGSGRTEAAVYSPTGGFIIYQPAAGGAPVTIDIGTANNGSIPVATPAGDLPVFAAPGSGSSKGIVPKAIVPPAGPTASPRSIVVTPSAAVPGGPASASIRAVRTLINQAETDPFAIA